jgi:hypothetical protein
MKKLTLLIFFSVNSLLCFADSDSDYKNEFRKNSYQSCFKEMTTGSDKFETKLANKICSCLSDKTVSSLSVTELKKYDKNPSAYKDLIEKFVSQCLI